MEFNLRRCKGYSRCPTDANPVAALTEIVLGGSRPGILGPTAVVRRDGKTQTPPPETVGNQLTTKLSKRHLKGARVVSFRLFSISRNSHHVHLLRQSKPILKQRLGSRVAESEGVCTAHLQGAPVP